MKRISITLRARDWATSMAGFTAVLVTLTVFDERVWYQLAILGRRGPEREFVHIGQWLSAFASALTVAARDQSLDHAPMLFFTAFAILLVAFMVRT